jgi:hypothetical protein
MDRERLPIVGQVILGVTIGVLTAVVVQKLGIERITQQSSVSVSKDATAEKSEKPAYEPGFKSVAPSQARPLNATQWISDFLKAFQGPWVENLEPFFDTTVSPYFRNTNANWDVIAKDKMYYFGRFPQIEYVLEGHPREIQRTDDSATIAFEYQYANVRKDGTLMRGRSHTTVCLHFVNGQWKISGIWEQTSE